MKKSIVLFFAAAFAVATPHSSFAWGKQGHEMVADIAASLLDTKTKDAVQKYLGDITFEHASTWMDEMRSNHAYDYMKPWHYVNIEKGGEYQAAKEGDVVSTLNKAITELEHRSTLTDEQTKMDLLLIFHLIGDLHMPLHAGYGTDKGGNSIKLKYIDKDANLHWVWDTQIIETENITTADCLERLKTYSKVDIAKDSKIDVTTWMNQSRSHLDAVYDFSNNTIDKAFADKNKMLIEDQLVLAGIRLAAVLNKAFKA